MITRRTFLKAGALFGGASLLAKWVYDEFKDPLLKLDQALQDAIETLPAVSISAAILKDGKLHWSKNYGYQDLASGTVMNQQSAWRSIGSISKLVVWTAVMRLVERGQLDLQRDISDYLGFRFRSPHHPEATINLSHLMTHASSIASRKMMSDPAGMADAFCKNNATLKEWVQDHLAPDGKNYDPALIFETYLPGDFANVAADPFGVITGYSNVNAVLAAYIVERVSKKTFETYCDEEIFKPCGMNETSFSKDKPLQWMTQYEARFSPRAPIMHAYSKEMNARGYASSNFTEMPDGREYSHFLGCDYYSPVYPMGLLGSSLHSLLPFFLAYLHDGQVNAYQLLRPESVQRILTLQRQDPANMQLGLGWFRQQDRHGRDLWGHEGGGPGVLTSAFICPQTGAGVLLFINNFHVDFRLRGQLLSAMNDIAFSSH